MRAAVAYGDIPAQGRAQAQIWRPPGVAETDRPLHGAPSRARRRGAARAGAAAPLADLEARLQPGGADRLGARPPRRARGAARPARAGQGDAAPARRWARASAARRGARRLPGRRRGTRTALHGRRDHPRRRRLYERRHRQCLRPHSEARRRGAGGRAVLGARCDAAAIIDKRAARVLTVRPPWRTGDGTRRNLHQDLLRLLLARQAAARLQGRRL